MEPTRRDELLERLTEIFLREGFRHVTVGELAQRLRCSRRALYELAPTKEGLFLLVVDDLLERIRRSGDDAARATADLPHRIEAYLSPGISETARASQFFTSDVAGFPAAKRLMEEHQRRRMEGLRGIIAEGVERGVFRGFDPHLVAEVFALAYRRATDPDFLSGANLSMTEAYRELSQLLRHGLLHAENGKTPKKRSPRKRHRAGTFLRNATV